MLRQLLIVLTLLPLLLTACTPVVLPVTPAATAQPPTSTPVPAVVVTPTGPLRQDRLSLTALRDLVPFPLLLPTELPEGYLFEAATLAPVSEEYQHVSIVYRSGGGELIINVWSMAGPLPPADERGMETITVRGQEARLWQDAGLGNYTLVWNENGIQIQLYAQPYQGGEALDRAALLQFVESMRPADQVTLAPIEQTPPPTMPPPTPFVAPTPDITTVPTATVPGGLGEISLPTDLDAAVALLERLPDEIAGHVRTRYDVQLPYGATVAYGSRQLRDGGEVPILGLQVNNLAEGDFFPSNWSGGQTVAFRIANDPNLIDVGRDGNLIWAYERSTAGYAAPAGSEAPAETVPFYALSFGAVDSPLLFALSADSQETLDALLAAFVEAAASR